MEYIAIVLVAIAWYGASKLSELVHIAKDAQICAQEATTRLASIQSHLDELCDSNKEQLREIERLRSEYLERHPGRPCDSIMDEDFLKEE